MNASIKMLYKRLGRVSKSQLFRVYDRSVQIAIGLITIIIMVRGLALMALHSVYLKIMQGYEVKRYPWLTASWLESTMDCFGPTYRDLGSLALVVYSVQFYLPLIFVAYKYAMRKRIARQAIAGARPAIDNPRQSYESICDSFDAFIDTMIDSNRHCAKQYVGKVNEALDNYDTMGDNHLASKPMQSRRFELNYHNMLSLSMRDQREYLLAVKQNKMLVWPHERSMRRRSFYIKWWLALTIFDTFVALILAHAVYYYLHVAAAEAIKERCLVKQRHTECGFTQIERLSLISDHLFAYTSVMNTSAPLSSLMVLYYDAMSTLFRLRRDMQTLRMKIRNNGTSADQDVILKYGGRMKDLCGMYNSTTGQFRRLMRIAWLECDRRMLHTYILIRLFIEDMRITIDYAQVHLDRMALVIIMSGLCISMSLPAIRPDHLSLYISAGLSIYAACNFVSLLAAALHASCLQANKQIWSLVASTVVRPRRLDYDEYLIENGKGEKLREDTVTIRSEHLAHLVVDCVTYHSSLLWYKLVANDYHVSTQGQVKLFGLYKLTYGGVLGINYWMTTFIMLYMTGRTQL